MEQFSAEEFFDIGEYLGKMGELFDLGEAKEHLSESGEPDALQFQIEGILDSCVKLDLRVSAMCAKEFLMGIDAKALTVGSARSLFEQLSNTIRREMQTVLFFHLPSSQVEFYDRKELFGKDVFTKFPDLRYDIVEAGTCLALGRSTACVFHLMRVMEAAVQALAITLDVTEVRGKNVKDADWHNILDAINKAIKPLPEKDPKTVILHEAANNLYHVKVAWRNQVMHPKATYSPDEAEDVLRQVKVFMGSMAKLELPPMGSTLIQ